MRFVGRINCSNTNLTNLTVEARKIYFDGVQILRYIKLDYRGLYIFYLINSISNFLTFPRNHFDQPINNTRLITCETYDLDPRNNESAIESSTLKRALSQSSSSSFQSSRNSSHTQKKNEIKKHVGALAWHYVTRRSIQFVEWGRRTAAGAL